MPALIEFFVCVFSGFIAMLLSYPIIRMIKSEWRWAWSVLILLVYSAVDAVMDRFWSYYSGRYAFFYYFAGCVLGGLLISFQARKTKKEVMERSCR